MRTGITTSMEHLGIGQKLMLAAGLLAASGFAFVSIASNLRFGVSLASTPFDRVIYGTLSIAADLMKIALPLVVAILWRKRERIFALAGAVFWIGAVAFSICAAIGFAASTRGQTVAASKSRLEARKAWEAKITRVEGRLDLLGMHRPSNLIQVEIDSLLRTPGTDGCKVINGPVTQDICPKVDRLRRELAASEEAARIEATLVADRRVLSEIPVAASVADPQSATLSRLTGIGEDALRSAIATMIAFLVELGSAFGFSVVILAARPTAERLQVLSVDEAIEPRRHATQAAHNRQACLSEAPGDVVTRWALARLDIIGSGIIQAELAYEDFRDCCLTHKIRPLTPQMFGRRFTAVHATMGGRKIRRRGRAYYAGVDLQSQPAKGRKHIVCS